MKINDFLEVIYEIYANLFKMGVNRVLMYCALSIAFTLQWYLMAPIPQVKPLAILLGIVSWGGLIPAVMYLIKHDSKIHPGRPKTLGNLFKILTGR